MFRPAWSVDVPGGARALVLARERGWLLAWDDADWLTLLDRAGRRQAQRHFPHLLIAAASDDGTAYAIAGKDGDLRWLAPDLNPRWERRLSASPLALALDPFGQYLVVADSDSHVQILDRIGTPVSQLTLPRPLHQLAFVPAAPFLVGSADFGLVAAFNLRGETLWLDGLVTNIGALCTDGAGRQILLACFSEGLHRYQADGKKVQRLTMPDPCRLASQSFDGNRILIGNMSNRLTLVDAQGRVLATHEMEKPVAALALGPLGKEAFVALAKGPVVRLELDAD
jgi:hypothetical protein